MGRSDDPQDVATGAAEGATVPLALTRLRRVIEGDPTVGAELLAVRRDARILRLEAELADAMAEQDLAVRAARNGG